MTRDQQMLANLRELRERVQDLEGDLRIEEKNLADVVAEVEARYIENAGLRAEIATLLRSGNQWRPRDTCPKHVEVLFWREDAGVMLGEFTSLREFLTEREIENSELSEEALDRDDFWAFCPDGLERLEGEDGESFDERPTHWMPLPAGPDAEDA